MTGLISILLPNSLFFWADFVIIELLIIYPSLLFWGCDFSFYSFSLQYSLYSLWCSSIICFGSTPSRWWPEAECSISHYFSLFLFIISLIFYCISGSIASILLNKFPKVDILKRNVETRAWYLIFFTSCSLIYFSISWILTPLSFFFNLLFDIPRYPALFYMSYFFLFKASNTITSLFIFRTMWRQNSNWKELAAYCFMFIYSYSK